MINDDLYFVECLYGNNDICQVYRQYTETFNLNNIDDAVNPINNHTHRRLSDITCRDEVELPDKERKCSTISDPNLETEETINTDLRWKSDGGTVNFLNQDVEIKLKSDQGSILRIYIDNTLFPECYYKCKSTKTCFPADTIVNTPDGDKYINNLDIGDKVLTINNYNGMLEYSDIYMHGHKIDNISTNFITLYTDNNDHNNEVSGSFSHWIYACEYKECEWNNKIIKRFEEIREGKDYIFDKNMNKNLIIKKEINEMDGIYAPFTINGNIIVNDKIASCYAKWNKDKYLISQTNLEIIYHFLLSPFRILYQYVPNDWLLFNTLYPTGIYDFIYSSYIYQLIIKNLIFLCQILY